MKKAARGGGQTQHAISKTNGPKGGKTKESVNPNKKTEKTLAPVRDFSEIAQEILKRDLELFGNSTILALVKVNNTSDTPNRDGKKTRTRGYPRIKSVTSMKWVL